MIEKTVGLERPMEQRVPVRNDSWKKSRKNATLMVGDVNEGVVEGPDKSELRS
jgi:hypothetical protein